MSLILAPHADDEIIGCYSLLKANQISRVIYFEELTPARRTEALLSADLYGFDALFAPDLDPSDLNAIIEQEPTIYIPAITDSHPAHKALNRRYRKHSGVHFYSVDLDRCQHPKVTVDEPLQKLAELNYCYSSQSDLWASNASYYLFESIVKQDYLKLYTFSFLDMEVETDIPDIVCSTSPESVFNELIALGANYVRIIRGKEIWRTL